MEIVERSKPYETTFPVMSSELSDADKERLEQMTLLDPALLKAKKWKPVTSQPKKKPGVWKSGSTVSSGGLAALAPIPRARAWMPMAPRRARKPRAPVTALRPTV